VLIDVREVQQADSRFAVLTRLLEFINEPDQFIPAGFRSWHIPRIRHNVSVPHELAERSPAICLSSFFSDLPRSPNGHRTQGDDYSASAINV
jgi:hypothetical protein